MITKSETIRLKQIIDYIKENADEIKAQTEITEIEFGELIRICRSANNYSRYDGGL